nr:Eukaryotic translation initiation factor 2-alpha kinase [Polyrhizophydium stewartii]
MLTGAAAQALANARAAAPPPPPDPPQEPQPAPEPASPPAPSPNPSPASEAAPDADRERHPAPWPSRALGRRPSSLSSPRSARPPSSPSTPGPTLGGSAPRAASAAALLSKKERQRKSRQSQLLLVSLLENFCLLYDQSGERNKRLFFVLCQQLSRMGIIDSSDFIEELSTVRESYKRAFRELVIQAMAAVQAAERKDTLIMYPVSSTASIHGILFAPVVAVASRNVNLACSPLSGPKPSFRHSERSTDLYASEYSALDFSNFLQPQTSRYRDDFEELGSLGRGAFGRVHRCRNKLDGREYAIKKISIASRNTNNVEKMLREVKLLARIANPHVVRYYSSWLEHVEIASGFTSDASDFSDDMSSGNEMSTAGSRSPMSTPDIWGFSQPDISISDATFERSANMAGGRLHSPIQASPVMRRSPSFPQPMVRTQSLSRLQIQWQSESDSQSRSHGCESHSETHSESESESQSESAAETDSGSDTDGEEIDVEISFSGSVSQEPGTPTTNTMRTEATVNTTSTSATAPTVRSTATSTRTTSTISLRPVNDFAHACVVPLAAATTRELTLFIQMELCEHTLHDWIERRNDAVMRGVGGMREDEALACFHNILVGLNCIHMQGLIHRDVKPKNIYWKAHSEGSAEGEWKLGDFGLATVSDFVSGEDGQGSSAADGVGVDSLPLRRGPGELGGIGSVGMSRTGSRNGSGRSHGHGPGRKLNRRISRTVGVGTVTVRICLRLECVAAVLDPAATNGALTQGIPMQYASPEQLDPKSTRLYSHQSDIYSLAIVFFELCHVCRTGMERAMLITNLRKGILPEELLVSRPKEVR